MKRMFLAVVVLVVVLVSATADASLFFSHKRFSRPKFFVEESEDFSYQMGRAEKLWNMVCEKFLMVTPQLYCSSGYATMDMVTGERHVVVSINFLTTYQFGKYYLEIPGVENLDYLTDDEILGIMCHEVGHIRLGHLYYLPGKDISIRQKFELEADAFAVKMGKILFGIEPEVIATALVKLDNIQERKSSWITKYLQLNDHPDSAVRKAAILGD